MRNATITVLFLAGTLALALGVQVSAEEEPIIVGTHRQLFVDDHIIADMRDVERALNQVERHPANPLVVPEHPWEGVDVYVYGAVLYDEREKLFKMWYMAWGPESSGKSCYATSEDGIQWTKPNLGLYKFRSADKTKATNLTNLRWALGVIHSPEDPDPARRYKGLAHRRGTFSADGLQWKVHQESKNIPGDIAGDDVIPYCYDELGGRYVAFPKVLRRSGKYLRRSVGVAFSKDFLEWTEAETVLIPDARDDELSAQRTEAMRDRVMFFEEDASLRVAQFYGLCAFPYEGMYLGLLWVLDISGWKPGARKVPGVGGEDGPDQIELVSSWDLRRWNRVADRKLIIPVGAKGSWEAGQIYTVNRPIIVGDQIRIYYGGMGHTHGHPMYHDGKEAVGIKSGIGLATLRLDGWVSIDAGKEEGALTTKALIFESTEAIKGKVLVINAEAPGGAVVVEILDGAGKPLSGFGKGECDALRGDTIRHVVKWRGKSDLSELAGRSITLRFYLRDAKLYSFSFQD